MNKIKYGTEFLDQLKDKVHELQWEIERLNNIIKKGITEEMKDELDVILKTNQKQAYRINKAIEYIEEKVGNEIHDMMYVIDVSDLLDILKEGDKE